MGLAALREKPYAVRIVEGLPLNASEKSAATDAVYCLLHRHLYPDRFPAQVRPDMPVARPRIVAERDGARLLCGNAHAGAHRWPDGEQVNDGSDGGDREDG